MDRIVTYVLFGEEKSVTIEGANSDDEARDLLISELAKFHIRTVTAIRQKPTIKRTGIWDLLKAAFTVKHEAPAE